MKLVDFVSDVLDEGDLKFMTYIRDLLREDELLPFNVVPYDIEESDEAILRLSYRIKQGRR